MNGNKDKRKGVGLNKDRRGWTIPANMGHVCTETLKTAAWVITEKYYMLPGNDFYTNKRMCKEIAIIPSKKLCTMIAVYVTHLMKQADSEKPDERGGHQAAERGERRENYIIEVGPGTKEMLKLLDFGNPSNLQFTQPTVGMNFKTPQGAI
ncbi:unnamed protein product [Nyctereutes procyonoides]|uniref:(raccoon dog) hypothetical protein n=1 Tax=Nyctereutes procyonoides TaxID=34880 RepID=A0A811ZTF9_NYCPR|nr:unnamed protein product [Nyctereutes procyonoides]